MFIKLIKYNLKYKIIIVFALIILLSLICFFIISNIYNLKSETNNYNHDILKLANYTSNLEKDIQVFINTNHGSKFYETRDDNSFRNVINDINLSSDLTDRLISSKFSADFKNKSDFNEISNLINLFFEKSNLLINYLIDIGYNEAGYLEDLIYTENSLKKKIELFGSSGNRNELQNLISVREGFVKEESNGLIQEFNSRSQNLLQNILQSQNGASVNQGRKQIVDAINDYLQKFEIITGLYKKIGLDKNEGLQKDLHGIINEIQILLKETASISYRFSEDKLRRLRIIRYIIVTLYFILSGLIVFLFLRPIYIRYLDLKKRISDISEGVIDISTDFDEGEFSDIMTFIKIHVKSLKEKNMFVNEIRKENYNIDFGDYTEKDEISKSLINLKESLIRKQKSEKQNLREREINDRMVSGLANFSNILRQNANDIEKLTHEIVFNLIEFMNAVIGGIYILDESDGHRKLNLHSSYAYNEKKLLEREINFGEGLVGTCAVDKATLYFETIPEDYIKIVSGFVESAPNSLLLVPLVIAEKTYGVIELAGLKEFSEFDIKFLETLGEDIASTLSYIKTS